jgi:hypothetical protein
MQMPGLVGTCIRVRACIPAYPACNAYAPCCDVIFRHYLIKGAILRKKGIEHKMSVFFLVNFVKLFSL